MMWYKNKKYSLFAETKNEVTIALEKCKLFSEQANLFNLELAAVDWNASLRLPENISMMNPYRVSKDVTAKSHPAVPAALQISRTFYEKFYADMDERILILGINPGRHGAGLTGIPFTDSERLLDVCEIDPMGIKTYEMSSVYIYQLIRHMAGAESFYRKFYINSPLPLGLLVNKPNGKSVNANYFDSHPLLRSVSPLINASMNSFKQMHISRSVVFVLGNSKNYRFVSEWNEKQCYFDKVVPLLHPRYVMQYKSKQKHEIIQSTANLLNTV